MIKREKQINKLIAFTVVLLSTFSTKVTANDAAILLNIQVQGKLIISDSKSDTNDNNTFITSPNKKFRIRTNLNNWQLIANRSKNINVSYKINASENANPNSARLVLGSTNSQKIIEGVRKTSLNRDKGNYNNYLEIIPTINDEKGFSTEEISESLITYSLVSL